MRKLLKTYFIPHKSNNYKPHLWRGVSLVFIFAIVTGLFAVAVISPTLVSRTGLTALVLPKVLVDYANADRQTENFRTLAINSTLEKAAQMKANDMASKGYFAHKSPDGKTPWYWFQQAGYEFSYAGENLAVNFSDSVDVNGAWMNSPGHRQNIMNGNFTEIGIATAEGVYQGRQTTFVVQLFGRPAVKEIPLVEKPTKTTTNITTKTQSTQAKVFSTIASSSVLGASGENDLYIAVENTDAPAITNIHTDTKTSYSTVVEKVLVSPSKSLSIVYLAIILIVLLGLVLLVFIEIKKQHPPAIFLAVLLLVFICTLLYLYQSVIITPLLIT
jgi:hypothetical protein